MSEKSLKMTDSIQEKGQVNELSDGTESINHVPFAGTYNAKEAALADEAEAQGTFWQLLLRYRNAWMWSMAISVALVMEGFDLGSINSFYGQSQFVERFGVVGADGVKAIPVAWQTGISNGSQSGMFFGLCIGGFFVEKVGYRKVYMSAMAWNIAVFFAVFFAPSLTVLAIGEGLLGMGLGVFQSLTTAYASEILPVSLRGYLTSYSNMCWGFGLLLASGVVRATLGIPGQWAYKLPWILQWVWPPILLTVAFFAPESPWWLVRKGREEEARKAISRLNGKDSADSVNRTLALIKHTNALEKDISAGTSFLECFKGDNLRRTELACMAFAMQLFCGSSMNAFAILFLQRAGLAETASFDFNIGMMANFVVGTMVSWLFLARIGRRTIYTLGMAALGLVALLIGILGSLPTSSGSSLGVGALLVVQTFVFNISIGPICYCIITEVSSTRLRAKTVALARAVYVVTAIICNIIQPRMIAEDSWNWGAKCGYFWFGLCALSVIYCYFRLPETKDRSYAEIDLLFANRVSARRFKTTKVDAFGVNSHIQDEPNALTLPHALKH